MSRSSWNFLVDCILGTLLLSVLITSAVVRCVFPAGTKAEGWTVWGYGFDTWADFHFGALAVLAVVILIHLVLHWKWVCGFVVGRMGRARNRPARVEPGAETLYGVGVLMLALCIVGGALFAAQISCKSPEGTDAQGRPIESRAANWQPAAVRNSIDP